MGRQGRAAAVGLGAGLLGGGLVFALLRPRPSSVVAAASEPTPPLAPAQVPGPPALPPTVPALPSSTPPGPPAQAVTAPMPELPSAERLKAIVAQYGASVERYQAFVADIAAGRGVSVAEYQKIKDAATKAGQAAGAVIAVAGAIAVGSQSAPVVGQVAGALAACVTFVAGLIQVFAPDSSTLSEQRAGVNLLGLEPPMSPGALLRTGWIRDSDTPAGCYYFDNIPIWGPDFDRFVASISSTDLRTLKAYRQLADLVHRWPYGPPEALALQIEVTTEELFLGLNRVGAKGTTLNYAPPYRVQWPTGVGGRPQYFETLDEIVAARGALPTQR